MLRLVTRISSITRSRARHNVLPFQQIAEAHSARPTETDSDLHVVFILPDGQTKRVPAKAGQSILETAHHNEVDLEGACEASLACSTCHVILPQKWFDQLPAPVEEEEDMLDLAFGLTETSRLGCQIILQKEMDGMEIKLPSATRNMAVDGFKPKPH